MNIEQLMSRIEEISKVLERGDISLEESLKLYEEASQLIKSAAKLLDEAEQKVMLLSKSETGGFTVEPFDAEASGEAQ